MEEELKFNLPEIVVTGKTKPKRKPLYRNPYHFNPKKWVAARTPQLTPARCCINSSIKLALSKFIQRNRFSTKR